MPRIELYNYLDDIIPQSCLDACAQKRLVDRVYCKGQVREEKFANNVCYQYIPYKQRQMFWGTEEFNLASLANGPSVPRK